MHSAHFIPSLAVTATFGLLRDTINHVMFNDLLKPMHFLISSGVGTLLFALIFK